MYHIQHNLSYLITQGDDILDCISVGGLNASSRSSFATEEQLTSGKLNKMNNNDVEDGSCCDKYEEAVQPHPAKVKSNLIGAYLKEYIYLNVESKFVGEMVKLIL